MSDRGGGGKRVAALGLLLAAILILGFIERQIPLSFSVPGVRLGLSNAAILLALYVFRFRTALLLAVLKSVMLAVFAGGISGFLYGFTGTMLSVLVMALLVRSLGERISPIGVSVAGATAHITGQYLVAAAIIQNIGILLFLPLPLLLSALSGILTGIAVRASRKPLLHSLE